MMISPDAYYEEFLKGKTVEEITTTIRGLKREIGHLKNTMEHPDYGRKPLIHPSEEVRLSCTRMYLERAKEALIEVGGTYKLSQAELKAAAFDKSIPAICKVVFSIGGFFGGYETRTYILDEEYLYMDVDHFPFLKPSDFEIKPDSPLTKEEFLDGIRELHIGEWRARYDPSRFGYWVLDGTQWELEIYFSDGHMPVKIHGSNSYPYNFDKFKELLGMDLCDDDMEEDE